MSLKRNILANYASQIYITLIGIVMLPIYIRYIGAEAYGLVGFFTMLQAWFYLLDMGLTPTMARETARHQGGAIDALSLRRLLRTLEGVFIGVALMGAVAIVTASDFIATMWLNVQALPISEVRNSVMLMGVIAALRWTCGPYRGAISGFERLVWLSGWNAFIATFRFVLVIPFFIFVGTSPTYFFSYQLGVALLELSVLVTRTYRLLPKVEAGRRTPWQWHQLSGVLKFSLSIAFTSSVWVLVTQTDKLVLSKLLPLADYGYFTLAVLVAGGVGMVSSPISSAIMPRMTRMQAAGDEAGLIQLYRDATQLIAVIAVPVALVLGFFPGQVLWAWTADSVLVSKAATVLTLYAIGTVILTFGAFPYYLQFAKGDLKLHLAGSLLFVLLLIPSLIWATWRFGMIGAGWAWLVANLMYFFFWVPLVHHRFARGLHWPWLLRDVGAICLPTLLVAFLLDQAILWPTSRLDIAFFALLTWLVLSAVASFSSGKMREMLASRCRLRIDAG